MMKQAKHILFGLLLLAATAFTVSCNSILGDDNIAAPQDGTMKLAFARSGESSSPTSGFLIFWKETMGDFVTAEIDDLNAYQITKYNTGELYPKEGTEVSATGFSPANMQLTDDYQTLSLPTGTTAGTLDVCTAGIIIKGSYYRPFGETMRFEHTLTKVTFSVKRDETMVGSRDVSNITVTIPTDYLATQWTWNDEKYTASQANKASSALDFTHPNIIKETDTDQIGTAYLMLPTDNAGKLKQIRVQANITPIESTTVENRIDKTIPIQLNEVNGTPVSNAQPGEAYTVIINFQQNSFTLEARQNDWEKGGLIYIPVKP